MLQEGVLTILTGIGILTVLGSLLWLSRRSPDAKSPKLVGPATILSLNAEYRHGWYYTGTFALSDGEIIQLHMLKYWYDTLNEGQSGQLTWQENTLADFEPDR